MSVLIDTNVIVHLLNPKTAPPMVDGRPLERCSERVELLVAELSDRGETVLLPTPVLAEVLTRAGDAGPAYLAIIDKQRHVRIASFDKLASVEAGRMLGKLLATGQWPRGGELRAKLKFDVMIAAIASVNRVGMVYSDDGGMVALGRTFGFPVTGLVQLPLPPKAAQGKLPL